MTGNKSRLQISVKPLGMRRVGIVRSSSKVVNAQTKDKMTELTGSELRSVIGDQVATNAKVEKMRQAMVMADVAFLTEKIHVNFKKASTATKAKEFPILAITT
jgi:hypothetical protein